MSTHVRSSSPPALRGAAILLLFVVLALAPAPVLAAGDAGWYTPDQAQQGHQLYNNICAQCHRPDLTGALGPALVGDPFLQKWGSKPLGELFDFEQAKMPAVNPGSVPKAEMWAITAYILQRNGFPAGGSELGPDTGPKRIVALK